MLDLVSGAYLPVVLIPQPLQYYLFWCLSCVQSHVITSKEKSHATTCVTFNSLRAGDGCVAISSGGGSGGRGSNRWGDDGGRNNSRNRGSGWGIQQSTIKWSNSSRRRSRRGNNSSRGISKDSGKGGGGNLVPTALATTGAGNGGDRQQSTKKQWKLQSR
jgi:hypothetical protein